MSSFRFTKRTVDAIEPPNDGQVNRPVLPQAGHPKLAALDLAEFQNRSRMRVRRFSYHTSVLLR